MIQHGTVRRALGWPGAAAVCAMGGLLLPLAPSFGQVSASTAPPAGGQTESAAGAGPALVNVTPAPAVAESSAAGGPVTAAPPAAVNERTELDEARAQVQRLRDELTVAEQRLAALEGRGRGMRGALRPAGGIARRNAGASDAQRLDALERQVGQILEELRQMRREMPHGPGAQNSNGSPGAGGPVAGGTEGPHTPTSSINAP